MQNEELAAQRQDRINNQSLDGLSKCVVPWLQLDHLLTSFLMYAYASDSACINIHIHVYYKICSRRFQSSFLVVAGVVENCDFHSRKSEGIHQKFATTWYFNATKGYQRSLLVGLFLQEIESLRGDKAGIEARVSRTFETSQDHFFILLSNVKRIQQ